MPPNMRSILAKVHRSSMSMVSRRNFSSTAVDSKDPKKRSTVKSVVTQVLGIGTLGYATGLYIGHRLSLEGG